MKVNLKLSPHTHPQLCATLARIPPRRRATWLRNRLHQGREAPPLDAGQDAPPGDIRVELFIDAGLLPDIHAALTNLPVRQRAEWIRMQLLDMDAGSSTPAPADETPAPGLLAVLEDFVGEAA